MIIPKELAELGASQIGVEFYPKKAVRYGLPYQSSGVFAYRYFDDHDLEIGYYLTATSTYHIFDTPRVWAPQYLRHLEWHIEVHNHD